MTGSNVTEIIKVLSQRDELMELLMEEPKTKPDLVRELDVSRRTVYRVIDRLEKMDIISSSDDKYELTFYGIIAFQKYKNLKDSLNKMQNSDDFSSSLPSEISIDSIFLKNADVTVSRSSEEFDKILDILEENFEDADMMKVFASKIPSKRYIDIFYTSIVEEGVDTELIIDPSFVQYLVFDYLDSTQNALECSNLEVYKTERDLPFGMVVVEKDGSKEAGIAVWDPEGDFSGMIWNGDENAVDWADSTFERYREDSEKIENKSL